MTSFGHYDVIKMGKKSIKNHKIDYNFLTKSPRANLKAPYFFPVTRGTKKDSWHFAQFHQKS